MNVVMNTVILYLELTVESADITVASRPKIMQNSSQAALEKTIFAGK
jgi:hypothetical protein